MDWNNEIKDVLNSEADGNCFGFKIFFNNH